MMMMVLKWITKFPQSTWKRHFRWFKNVLRALYLRSFCVSTPSQKVMVPLFPWKTTIPSSLMPCEDAKGNDVSALAQPRGFVGLRKLKQSRVHSTSNLTLHHPMHSSYLFLTLNFLERFVFSLDRRKGKLSRAQFLVYLKECCC